MSHHWLEFSLIRESVICCHITWRVLSRKTLWCADVCVCHFAKGHLEILIWMGGTLLKYAGRMFCFFSFSKHCVKLTSFYSFSDGWIYFPFLLFQAFSGSSKLGNENVSLSWFLEDQHSAPEDVKEPNVPKGKDVRVTHYFYFHLNQTS